MQCYQKKKMPQDYQWKILIEVWAVDSVYVFSLFEL